MKMYIKMTNAELNEAIAVEVMGWHEWYVRGYRAEWRNDTNDDCEDVEYWQPAENISQAWQVVEKMREKGWYLTLKDYAGLWHAEFNHPFGGMRFSRKSNSVTKEICRSALAVVRIKNED